MATLQSITSAFCVRSESVKNDRTNKLSSKRAERKRSARIEVRMLYGKRAALHLNKRRMSLQKQHADLRALLRELPDPALSAGGSERIASIRTLWIQSLKDSIQVCSTLSERIYVLNLEGCADALMANSRLSAVCQQVEKTLSELNTPDT